MREFAYRGKTYARGPILLKLFQRLAAQPNGCWVWKGSKTVQGYGNTTLWVGRGVVDRGQIVIGVHRLMHELFTGPIPDGYHVDHLCRNPSCANPAHLEAVTAAENNHRGNSGKYNRDRTHCKQGHEFTPENTLRKGNRRLCRACRVRWRKEALGRVQRRISTSDPEFVKRYGKPFFSSQKGED